MLLTLTAGRQCILEAPTVMSSMSPSLLRTTNSKSTTILNSDNPSIMPICRSGSNTPFTMKEAAIGIAVSTVLLTSVSCGPTNWLGRNLARQDRLCHKSCRQLPLLALHVDIQV